MTEHKKKKLKKVIFPVGIFLLMFTTQTVIGLTGVVSYFYFSGKKNILEIENYTVNYSKTMAEAFAGVAELSYPKKKYASLKTLFHEKIEENTIDEAFFVLSNGKIIVHSSTTAEKELMWNIGNDEMAYNLDMILLPVKTKNRELILNNYNIINKAVPFKRQERDLITKYVYNDLNSTGWLFTKAIFYKNKPVGTVNFIISKDRIYSSIKELLDLARYYSLFVAAVSMVFSFIVSIIVFLRYRSIQKNASSSYSFDEKASIITSPVIIQKNRDTAADHGDAVFSAADNNFVDPDMDSVIEDDFDHSIINEDGLIIPIPAREKTAGGIRHELQTDEDEEYITVELLGEIEPEPDRKPQMSITPTVKEYIAPVISLADYKNSINNEIRDAIPVRRKK